MTQKNSILILCFVCINAVAKQSTPMTMRVDYFHTGNATQELFSLDEVVIEPLNIAVPIPITLSVDDIRVIVAEEDKKNE
mgnify:CR=1 FL=1